MPFRQLVLVLLNLQLLGEEDMAAAPLTRHFLEECGVDDTIELVDIYMALIRPWSRLCSA